VLAQDYEHIEYVLVDNHSTDGSRAIAERYADKDARIRLLQPPTFLPQVENYNFALAQISGQSAWCKMCQADDWLYPRCVTEMVALGEEHPTVGLISSYSWRGEQLLCLGLPHDISVLPGSEACRLHLLEPIFLFGSPTTACFELLSGCDFGFVHQVLSYRSVDAASITGSVSDLLSRELDHLIIVMRFARAYLDEDDAAAVRTRTLRDYYRRVGQRLMSASLTGGARSVLDYQRIGLRSVDMRLQWPALVAGIGRASLGAVASPAVAARLARRRIPGRHGSNSEMATRQ
jgi:glycosyltransferase involved in cell wall biosynthesis